MRTITILIFVLLFLSCNNDKENNNLIGNWSTIDNDSLYYEINVDSSYMQFYNYDTSFSTLRPYVIKNDTLFMRLSENEKISYDYVIEYSDNTKILLKSNTTKVEMELFRIDSIEFTFDKITNNKDQELQFEVAHLNRRNKLFGINYRYNLDSVTKVFKEMEKPIVEEIDSVKN